MSKRAAILIVAAVLVIAALAAFFIDRGDHAMLPETAASGPSPTLPATVPLQRGGVTL
jgi:hypothetical protein